METRLDPSLGNMDAWAQPELAWALLTLRGAQAPCSTPWIHHYWWGQSMAHSGAYSLNCLRFRGKYFEASLHSAAYCYSSLTNTCKAIL